MSETTVIKKSNGGIRQGAGRPQGATSTIESDLVARLRAARGITQFDMSVETGIPLSTLRRYEKQNLLPASGPVRQALERAAKRAGITNNEVAK